MKNAVDDGMASGMRRMWSAVREIGAGAFVKGALITGLVITASLALVGGYMGSGSELQVGSAVMNTFEKGFGAGIDKALQFLSHGMGLVAMALGGTLAVGSEIMDNQRKLAAAESERLALEYRRSREQQHGHGHHHHHHHHHPARGAAAAMPQPHRDRPDSAGIYVKGSVMKNERFCAAELKRRTERETFIGHRAV